MPKDEFLRKLGEQDFEFVVNDIRYQLYQYKSGEINHKRNNVLSVLNLISDRRYAKFGDYMKEDVREDSKFQNDLYALFINGAFLMT